jgi:hypothetical protein
MCVTDEESPMNPVVRTALIADSFVGHVRHHPRRSLVTVPKDVPLDLLGPMACGLSTGAGAVLNTLRPPPYDLGLCAEPRLLERREVIRSSSFCTNRANAPNPGLADHRARRVAHNRGRRARSVRPDPPGAGLAHRYAACPVRACPTTRVWISFVPS